MIDLRSDTVTKPTKGMLEAMMSARVGDDVYGEDPSVNELEQKVADLFGMEAALFCASGTMSNQICIRLITNPQEEIICDRTAHIYNYEAGGVASNSGASMRLLHGERGIMDPADILENINPENDHCPRTTVVAIENTSNRGGGSIYTMQRIRDIGALCREHKLLYHLDGARIFNALQETGDSPKELGKLFDTISVCLSKGLGTPAGSLVISSKERISRGRRIRKAFGGGMRQAGYFAAAGIYALDHHIHRLKEDHARAKRLEKAVKALPFVEQVLPVETNIVLFHLNPSYPAARFTALMKEKGILVSQVSKTSVRMLTHLDVGDEMIDTTISALKELQITNYESR